MIRIECPILGPRPETEFVYGGDATVKRPDMSERDPDAWLDYVFHRDNPRGIHKEYWQHIQARHWLVVERDTLTHEVIQASLAREYQS
ncbi:MAG: sarcosine oxidase subunit delta [Pseudomonadota bacterium]